MLRPNYIREAEISWGDFEENLRFVQECIKLNKTTTINNTTIMFFGFWCSIISTQNPRIANIPKTIPPQNKKSPWANEKAERASKKENALPVFIGIVGVGAQIIFDQRMDELEHKRLQIELNKDIQQLLTPQKDKEVNH